MKTKLRILYALRASLIRSAARYDAGGSAEWLLQQNAWMDINQAIEDIEFRLG